MSATMRALLLSSRDHFAPICIIGTASNYVDSSTMIWRCDGGRPRREHAANRPKISSLVRNGSLNKGNTKQGLIGVACKDVVMVVSPRSCGYRSAQRGRCFTEVYEFARRLPNSRSAPVESVGKEVADVPT